MATENCTDCQPIAESAPSTATLAKTAKPEDVLDPTTFVKPDLSSEVHVTIEYCNRW